MSNSSKQKYVDGFLGVQAPCLSDQAPHGLRYQHNHEFFLALLDVLELLRVESLIRECHAVHEKIVDLAKFVKESACQDFVSSKYPNENME